MEKQRKYWQTNFAVIQNNGKYRNHENACLWIAIMDFFKLPINTGNYENITMDEIFYYLNIKHWTKMWDIDNKAHIDALLKLCKLFNIVVHIRYANEFKNTKPWLGSFEHCFGDANNESKHIGIVYWGNRNHFELIVTETPTTPGCCDINKVINNNRILIYSNPDYEDENLDWLIIEKTDEENNKEPDTYYYYLQNGIFVMIGSLLSYVVFKTYIDKKFLNSV